LTKLGSSLSLRFLAFWSDTLELKDTTVVSPVVRDSLPLNRVLGTVKLVLLATVVTGVELGILVGRVDLKLVWLDDVKLGVAPSGMLLPEAPEIVLLAKVTDDVTDADCVDVLRLAELLAVRYSVGDVSPGERGTEPLLELVIEMEAEVFRPLFAEDTTEPDDGEYVGLDEMLEYDVDRPGVCNPADDGLDTSDDAFEKTVLVEPEAKIEVLDRPAALDTVEITPE